MADKSKSRKIDLRVAEDVFEEITLVVWVSKQKRSELLRMMIGFFIEHAKINSNGQSLGWTEILEVARDKQVAENITFAEICRSMSGRQTARPTEWGDMGGCQTVRPTELEVSDELGSELQVFAEIYAKSAIEAFKKYKEVRNDG